MQLFMPTLPQNSNELKRAIPDSLAPLSTIRTETVFSRLPIHNLAKKGKVDIQILRKNARGEIDLKWEISYSDRYGQPRQIAYKLDTIVINRKIDELSKPLPRVICLGSLRTIAEDLGLTRNTNIIKKAMQQNVGVLITAKLRYTDVHDIERTLDAYFTRYSVVFTGERLPDGRTADAVYIVLNEPYLEVLNNAPTRPLDYEYLKILTPAAQRFYEIVSFKIYAALKYRHAAAKISYSEYCTFSAQQRYQDYDHVKKQMYKVHRPHLQSGYLKKVSCDAVQDADGNPDWMFFYIPGPKAVAEFRAFNKKHPLGDVAMEDAIEVEASVSAPAKTDTGDAQAQELVAEFYRKFHKAENTTGQPKEIAQATRLISKHGIEKARHLVNFCHQIAPSTKFNPQVFGGLFQFEGRAVADFDKRQRGQKAHAVVAACSLCNHAGLVSLRNATGSYTSVKCTHDADQMHAAAKSQGYQIV